MMKKIVSLVLVALTICGFVAVAFAATCFAAETPAVATAEYTPGENSIVEFSKFRVTHLDISGKYSSCNVSYINDATGESGVMTVSASEYAKLSEGDTFEVYNLKDSKYYQIISEPSTDKYIVDFIREGNKKYVVLSTGERVKVYSMDTIREYKLGQDWQGYSYVGEVIVSTIGALFAIAVVLFFIILILSLAF